MSDREEREERRAERGREREERHRLRAEVRGLGSRAARAGVHGAFAFLAGRPLGIDLGDIVPGEEATQTVEGRFTVSGMARLRVRNVSGSTTITAGPSGEVRVRARKRVRGASAERAKRLLENVEVRMEQEGDEVRVEPHLYEQERGWLELLRGGRVAVDLEITVPREAQIEAKTVSGDVRIEGTRGPLEVQGVSAELEVEDVQGPLRLRTVSGDACCVEYKGQVEANSVSGDLRFERSRLRRPDLIAVSGDVSVEGEIAGPDEGRVKTVSGDVELELVEGSYDITLKTVSGSLDCDIEGRVTTEGRRDKRVVIGAGDAPLMVKTVSGDLTIRRSAAGPTTEPDRASDERASVEDTIPMGPPAEPADAKADVMSVLARVARGELSVADAAAALDARRGR